MRKVMIILGMVILVGLVGCGKNDSEESKGREEARKSEKKSIVGKWQEVDGDQIIEFFKDETVIIYDVDKDKESGLPGDYKFIDKNQIRMNVALFGPITAEISSSMDEITLTNPFGIVEKYRKLEESVREEKPARFLTATPEKEVPSPKIVFSRGLFQIGDFSVALSLVERETRRTNLHFLVTKIKEPGLVIEPLAITLTDDHQNKYYGTLEIIPHDDFPLHLLPVEFSYRQVASVVMPEVAPIETIQLEETQVSFKKLKLVKPQIKTDFGTALLSPGKPTLVGKYLLFAVQGITPDFYTWALELTIENKEYNELKGAIWSGVQFSDGRVSSLETPVVQEIAGLSKKKIRLPLQSLRGQEISKPLTILVFYQDCSSGQTVLKLWPISDKNLPPRVGQGTDEEIFIQAYQRNGGRQVIGDPVGLPRWYAGDTKPKDGQDLLIQEFPESLIIWDKQSSAPNAYVLFGAALEKYRELEGPYYLGAPTADVKSSRSIFGTEANYSTFETGVLIFRAGQITVVTGKIFEKWKEKDLSENPLSFPISDETSVASGTQGSDTAGLVQKFEGGLIYCVAKGEQAGKVFEIHGPIAEVYSKAGAETSWLGFPVTETYKNLGLKPTDQMEFEAGYIGSRDEKKWEAFPYEPGQIAFVSNRDGNQEIYVMDADGRNQINLTNNPADDDSPAWSPDGRRIVFESKRSGNSNVYIMDADGSNQRRLTHDMSGSPTWFPDGSMIAFSGNCANPYDKPLLGIYVVSADGTGQRLIWQPTRGANIKGYGIDPAVSPDGREIAFGVLDPLHGKTTQMWIMNSDGTRERRVNIGQYSPAGFCWSPLGNAVIFYLPNLWARDLHEGKGIGVTDPRTGITALVTDNFGKDPSFSPDGKWIVFSHQGEIYIADVTGSLGRKITKETKGENWSPSWTTGKQEGKTKAIPTEETIPAEKTISTEKVIPDTEISEADIPGKYILEELDSQGNSLGKEPGIMTFQEDGSIIGSYSGRWLFQNEEINFFEGSKKIGKGKLLAGAIVNWQVEDVPSWQAEKILKKEGAEMIRKISEWIIVWSEYFFPGNKSFSLKLQRDGSFSMSGLLGETWKIENGAIQIYKGDEKTDFSDGRLEGKNIVFKLEDGLVRLTRQN